MSGAPSAVTQHLGAQRVAHLISKDDVRFQLASASLQTAGFRVVHVPPLQTFGASVRKEASFLASGLFEHLNVQIGRAHV